MHCVRVNSVKHSLGATFIESLLWLKQFFRNGPLYEGWNFNSGNYLFTTDTK